MLDEKLGRACKPEAGPSIAAFSLVRDAAPGLSVLTRRLKSAESRWRNLADVIGRMLPVSLPQMREVRHRITFLCDESEDVMQVTCSSEAAL